MIPVLKGYHTLTVLMLFSSLSHIFFFLFCSESPTLEYKVPGRFEDSPVYPKSFLRGRFLGGNWALFLDSESNREQVRVNMWVTVTSRFGKLGGTEAQMTNYIYKLGAGDSLDIQWVAMKLTHERGASQVSLCDGRGFDVCFSKCQQHLIPTLPAVLSVSQLRDFPLLLVHTCLEACYSIPCLLTDFGLKPESTWCCR